MMDMESKPQESPDNSHPVPVYLLPYADQIDKISLIDTWKILLRQKWIILLGLFASVILAVVYNFSVDPVFRAKTHLLPPQQQDIQGLLIEDVDIKHYTPDIVYKTFKENLNSHRVRRGFFDTYNLMDHYLSGQPDTNINKLFDKNFNRSLQVLFDKDDIHSVSVTFDYVDPELAAKWLNQFIDFASKFTIQQISGEINTLVREEIDNINYQISNKLKLAGQKRRDSITKLREAARIARKLGVENTEMFSLVSAAPSSDVAIITGELPLYMHGVKALEAEISELEARKSDEPYIAGLRDLQQRLVFLKGITIDTKALSSATIDMIASIPYEMEKPRKVRVLVLSIVLGLILGIFGAFVSEFASKSRRVST